MSARTVVSGPWSSHPTVFPEGSLRGRRAPEAISKTAHWRLLRPLRGLASARAPFGQSPLGEAFGAWRNDILGGVFADAQAKCQVDRSVVNGQSSVVSGQWSVVSGQWSVVSGPWSVVSGPWSVAGESDLPFASHPSLSPTAPSYPASRRRWPGCTPPAARRPVGATDAAG